MVVCAREPGPSCLASLPNKYRSTSMRFRQAPVFRISWPNYRNPALPSGCRCRKVAPLRNQNFSSHHLAPAFLAKLQPAPYLTSTSFDVPFSTSSQQSHPRLRNF